MSFFRQNSKKNRLLTTKSSSKKNLRRVDGRSGELAVLRELLGECSQALCTSFDLADPTCSPSQRPCPTLPMNLSPLAIGSPCSRRIESHDSAPPRISLVACRLA